VPQETFPGYHGIAWYWLQFVPEPQPFLGGRYLVRFNALDYGQDTSAEVIAAAFAVGYSTAGGYASGVLVGSYKFADGQFVVNSFPILENIDYHPAADRLLLNFYSVPRHYRPNSRGRPSSEFQRATERDWLPGLTGVQWGRNPETRFAEVPSSARNGSIRRTSR
jgi:hypothetical protein